MGDLEERAYKLAHQRGLFPIEPNPEAQARIEKAEAEKLMKARALLQEFFSLAKQHRARQEELYEYVRDPKPSNPRGYPLNHRGRLVTKAWIIEREESNDFGFREPPGLAVNAQGEAYGYHYRMATTGGGGISECANFVESGPIPEEKCHSWVTEELLLEAAAKIVAGRDL